MNAQLQKDKDQISSILEQTVQIAEEYFGKQNTLQPSFSFEDEQLDDLEEKGKGAEAVLDQFKKQYAAHMANSAGPRYFGFVTGGSTPASVAGDWLVSVYDQVMSGSNDSAAHFIERQTLHFLKQLFSLDE